MICEGPHNNEDKPASEPDRFIEAIRRKALMFREPPEFYIATTKHEALWPRGVILFWAANERGYSSFLEKAGRYSKEEAEQICKPDSNHFMIPCEAVEAQAVRVVDIDKLEELKWTP